MKVAIAIIKNAQGKLLITQRANHSPQGGFWEFPGGKLEEGEAAELALIRELQEEIGIMVRQYRYIGTVNHNYVQNSIDFMVFLVNDFTGNPECLEDQLNIQWVEESQLNWFKFPEANNKIIALFLEHQSLCI